MKKSSKDQRIRISKCVSIEDCTLVSKLLETCNGATDAMISIDYEYGGDLSLSLQWTEIETDEECKIRLKQLADLKAKISKNKRDAAKAKEAADKKLYLELKKKFEK